MTTYAEFDPLAYSANQGIDYDSSYDGNDEIKQYLYDDAAKQLFAELHNPLSSKDDTLKQVFDTLPDARKSFGVSEERTQAEQYGSISVNGYSDYVRTQNKFGAFPEDADADTLVEAYVSSLHKDKWANPRLAEMNRKYMGEVIRSSLGEKYSSLGEVLNPPELDALPSSDPEEEGFGFMAGLYDVAGRSADAFTRSWRNNDVQEFTSNMLDGTTDQGTVDKYVKAVQHREEIPLDDSLKAVLKQGMSFSEGMSAIMSHPSAPLMMMMEGGTDFLEEGGTQLGATLLASPFVTPVGGVAAGASSMGLVVRENVENSYFDQEIQKYLQGKKLEFNSENVNRFFADEEAVQLAKDKAATTARIVAAGAVTSGLVGSGQLFSQTAKLAGRMGLIPVMKGGSLILEKAPTVGSILGAGAAASVIDVGADVIAKTTVGDTIEVGEIILAGTSSIGGAVVDVTSGVVSRRGATSPYDVRQGMTLVDKENGQAHIVAGLNEEGELSVVSDVNGKPKPSTISVDTLNNYEPKINSGDLVETPDYQNPVEQEPPAPPTPRDPMEESEIDVMVRDAEDSHEENATVDELGLGLESALNHLWGADQSADISTEFLPKPSMTEFDKGKLMTLGDRLLSNDIPDAAEVLSLVQSALLPDSPWHKIFNKPEAPTSKVPDAEPRVPKSEEDLIKVVADAEPRMPMSEEDLIKVVADAEANYTDESTASEFGVGADEAMTLLQSADLDSDTKTSHLPSPSLSEFDEAKLVALGDLILESSPDAKKLDIAIKEALLPSSPWNEVFGKPVTLEDGVMMDVRLDINNPADDIRNKGDLAQKKTPREIDLQVKPTTIRPVSIDWGHLPSNFIPESSLQPLTDAGYEVTHTEEGVIAITHPDRSDAFWVKTRGVTDSVAQNKDRKAEVWKTVNKPDDLSVVQGVKVKSLGGEKNFTIPPDNASIDVGGDLSSFRQQVRDVAQGMKIPVTKIESEGNVSSFRTNDKKLVKVENVPATDDSKAHVKLTIAGEETIQTTSFIIATSMTKVRKAKARVARTRNGMKSYTNATTPVEKQSAVQFSIAEPVTEPSTQLRDMDVVYDSDDVERTDSMVQSDTFKAIEADLPPDSKAGDWNARELLQVMKMIPEHIRDSITLHLNGIPDQPPNVLGFFSPNFNGEGAKIHINANPATRSLHSVLSTLSEEVAHFSMHSWGTGMKHLAPIYDKAFDLFRKEITDSLGVYIKAYKVDMSNPSASHKYTLVNEMFSKKGTSLMGFVDKKASDIADFSSTDLNAFKREARDNMDSYFLDMDEVAGINANDREEVRGFAKQLLQMQTSGALEKRTQFEFLVGEGVERRTLRIVNLPMGQSKRLSSITPDAIRLRKRRQKIEKHDGTMKGFRVFLTRNAIHGGGISGRKIQRIITNGSAIATQVDNQALREKIALTEKMKAVIKTKGVNTITAETFSRGAERTFVDLGITNKSYLGMAKQYDSMLGELQSAKIDENENMLSLVRDQVRWVQGQFDNGKVEPRQAAVIIGELQKFARRMRLDWQHRRYEAYESTDYQQTLRDMLRYLRQDKGAIDLKAQHDEATARKKEIINKGSLKGVALNVAIAKEDQKIMPYARLQHLKEMIRLRKNANQHDPIRDDVVEMGQFISRIIDTNDQYMGVGAGAQKMSHISANRSTKIDHNASEHTSDWHKIKFLGLIDDPVEVGIYNIQQQKEIMRMMNDNFLISKQLVDNDQASLGVAQDNVDVSFGMGQDGTVLKFLAVDPLVASDLRAQMSIQQEVTSNMFTDFVSHVKIMQTVGSVFGHASNWINAISLMALYGDISHVTKMYHATKGTKQSWSVKMHGKDHKGATPYVKQIIEEMQSSRVLGTGISTLTVDIANKNGVAQKMTSAMTKLAVKTGVIGEVRQIGIEDSVRSTIDTIKEMYTIADDVPKILRYMITRDMMEAKWTAKLKRSNYPSDESYNDDVTRMTVADTADRTLRENTDFSAIPFDLKRIAYNNGRVVFGNFISHSAMLIKIHSENVRIWGELRSDLKEAKALGATKWAKTLRSHMLHRAMGNGLVYSGLGMGIATGASMFTGIANSFVGAIADEENIPSEDEMFGASMMMQHLPYYKAGINYNPLTYKEGDNIYAIDGARMDYHGALAVVPDPTADPDRVNQLLRLPQSLFLAGDQGNIVEQVGRAIRGLDWKNEKIKDSKAYRDNLFGVMGTMSIPAGVREATSAFTSRSWYSGKRAPDSEFIAKLGGVRVKSFNVPKMITSMGQQIGNELLKNSVINSTLREMELGRSELEVKDVITLVRQHYDYNEKLDAEYRHFIEGARRYGYSDGKIVKHLTTNADYKTGVRTFLKKKQATLLVKRGAVFNQATYDRIDKVVKKVAKRKTSKTYTAQDKRNALHNLKLLKKQYRRTMKK